MIIPKAVKANVNPNRLRIVADLKRRKMFKEILSERIMSYSIQMCITSQYMGSTNIPFTYHVNNQYFTKITKPKSVYKLDICVKISYKEIGIL